MVNLAAESGTDIKVFFNDTATTEIYTILQQS